VKIGGGQMMLNAAEGVTGRIAINGGNTTIGSIGEINSRLDFMQKDLSVTVGIGGSIACVSEYSNGAYAGLAFYTAEQSRSPELKECLRLAFNGIATFYGTAPTSVAAGEVKIGGGVGRFAGRIYGGSQLDVTTSMTGDNPALLRNTHSAGYGPVFRGGGGGTGLYGALFQSYDGSTVFTVDAGGVTSVPKFKAGGAAASSTLTGNTLAQVITWLQSVFQ
jgi:hypothetical protein